jgi:hypothetical protein
MQPVESRGLFDALKQLSDPRGCQGQRHPFQAMLAAMICATLCGVRGFKPLAQWLRSQEPKTWHWLGFKRKPPCANCFSQLLRLIDPEEFERVIREWTKTLDGIEMDESSLRAVSIDGKTLRGTWQQHTRAVHLLAALDHQTGYVLSQTRVDEKTNEARTALTFLKTLVGQGRVIVGDAMFCHRELCQEVVDSGGDYFVVVKDNQPTLRKDVELAFADAEGFSPLPAA